jgi:hypothetical protein
VIGLGAYTFGPILYSFLRGAGSTVQDHLFRDFKPRARFHENLFVELPVKVSLLNFSAVLGGEGKDRAQRCELGEGLDRLVVLVDALVCVEPCATTRGFVLLDFAVGPRSMPYCLRPFGLSDAARQTLDTHDFPFGVMIVMGVGHFLGGARTVRFGQVLARVGVGGVFRRFRGVGEYILGFCFAFDMPAAFSYSPCALPTSGP